MVVQKKKCDTSKAKIRKISIQPANFKFGSSPDALRPAKVIEIKTRALNSEGTLQSLEKFPNNFVQTQLQITWIGASFCTLLSYHPETESRNSFLIQKHNLLVFVIMDVCNFVCNDQMLDYCSH